MERMSDCTSTRSRGKTLATPKGKEGGETKHAAARQTDATQTRHTSVTGRQERRSGRQDPAERRPSSPPLYSVTLTI
jgi:hypothetical protein